METAEVIRPLRRVEFDHLVMLGVFRDERVELLEGALIEMSPVGPAHDATVARLSELLALTLHGRVAVRRQAWFAAREFSEPQPDLALVPLADYSVNHPSTAHLIVEVADSSLDLDHGKKLRIYASCGITEYWVVNLPEQCIEVYTRPTPSAYALVQRYEPGESVRPLAFTDASFAVSELLA